MTCRALFVFPKTLNATWHDARTDENKIHWQSSRILFGFVRPWIFTFASTFAFIFAFTFAFAFAVTFAFAFVFFASLNCKLRLRFAKITYSILIRTDGAHDDHSGLIRPYFEEGHSVTMRRTVAIPDLHWCQNSCHCLRDCYILRTFECQKSSTWNRLNN